MAHILAFTLNYDGVVRMHDAILCLAKFGEQVSLEARHERLTLTALNSSKSAYASFRLDKKAFFERYNYWPNEAQSQLAKDENEFRFTCQLYNKALLSVFKGRLGDNRERDTAVERCEVVVEDETQRVECQLIIKMICRHGVVKTYKLTYEGVEVMHALFDRSSAKNTWRIGSGVLRNLTEYFGAGTEQLDIYAEEGRVRFDSYTEKVMNDREILKHPLQTSVAIDTLDFEEFTVEERLRIGISVKDFKAIVLHAEKFKTSVSAFYSHPNRPMQLSYHEHGMLCEFTLMTVGDYRSSSSTPNPANIRTVSRATSEQQHSQQDSRQTSVHGPGLSLRQIPKDEQVPQQQATASMPPPSGPASRTVVDQTESQRPSRPMPPPPKTSLDPDSLFLPQDDDEDSMLWGEKSNDDEQDVLGWNPHADTASFSQSFHSLRQDQEASAKPESFHNWPTGSEMRIPPTQKLSDIPDVFGED